MLENFSILKRSSNRDKAVAKAIFCHLELLQHLVLVDDAELCSQGVCVQVQLLASMRLGVSHLYLHIHTVVHLVTLQRRSQSSYSIVRAVGYLG